MNANAPTSQQNIRHASRDSDPGMENLCGLAGRTTRPKETVNCTICRMILNHVREQYPQHADYTDWRSTPAELRQAARAMAADMMGGADD